MMEKLLTIVAMIVNDEFDVVDEAAIETADQRMDRINTELKRLEDRIW